MTKEIYNKLSALQKSLTHALMVDIYNIKADNEIMEAINYHYKNFMTDNYDNFITDCVDSLNDFNYRIPTFTTVQKNVMITSTTSSFKGACVDALFVFANSIDISGRLYNPPNLIHYYIMDDDGNKMSICASVNTVDEKVIIMSECLAIRQYS